MDARDYAAWLAQVHGDAELPATSFKFVFELAQAADAAGLIRQAKIARSNSTMIKQLVARGHLELNKRGGKSTGYKIVMRDHVTEPAKTVAVKIIFPIEGQKKGFVRRLAQQMIAHPIEDAEAILRRELQRRQTSLVLRGIDDMAIRRHLRDLDSAIRSELWKLILGRSPNGNDAA